MYCTVSIVLIMWMQMARSQMLSYMLPRVAGHSLHPKQGPSTKPCKPFYMEEQIFRDDRASTKKCHGPKGLLNRLPMQNKRPV